MANYVEIWTCGRVVGICREIFHFPRPKMLSANGFSELNDIPPVFCRYTIGVDCRGGFCSTASSNNNYSMMKRDYWLRYIGVAVGVRTWMNSNGSVILWSHWCSMWCCTINDAHMAIDFVSVFTGLLSWQPGWQSLLAKVDILGQSGQISLAYLFNKQLG